MKTVKKYISLLLVCALILSLFVGLGSGFSAAALTQNIPSVSNTYDEDGMIFENYGTYSANDVNNATNVYSKVSVGGWYKYIPANKLKGEIAKKAPAVTTNGWEKVTETFTTNGDSEQKPLMLQLRSLQAGQPWWASHTNAYIDNIVISKTVTDDAGNKTVQVVTSNTYDEEKITYSYTGAFSEDTCPATGTTYTEMTVNGITRQIGMNNVFVEKYPDSGADGENHGYAAHIGRTQNGNNDLYGGLFATLQIYDSNNENLYLFVPEASTTYTISFDYRLDKADTAGNKSIYLDLLYTNAAKRLTYNNVQVEEYKYTDSASGEEVSEGKALHFGIAKNGTCYWSNYYSHEKIGVAFIYNSSNGYFTPKANTSYKLTLKYRSESVPSKKMALRLVTAAGDEVYPQSVKADNILINNVANISGVTAGWQNVSVEFTTGAAEKPLMLALGTEEEWWAENVDVWVDNISVTPIPEKEPDLVGMNYEILFSEDFSDVAEGTLPDGWFRDYPYNFLWAADKTTGLTANTVGVVADGSGDNYLAYRSTNGDHILTLPDIGTDNYRFTVKMRYASGGTGAFGIVSELKGDYEETTGANILMLRAGEVADGEISVVNRANNSIAYGGQNAVIKQFDAKAIFAGGYPAVNEEVTLTCYHYEGVSHYYINGTFVASLQDSDSLENTRLGLYNSYGANAQVLSVTVEEILTPSVAKNYYYETENIFNEDFSLVADGAVPEGWDKEHRYVSLWAGDKVDTSNTAVKTDKNGVKYLNIDAAAGDYVMTLPALNTENYRYSVKLRYTADSIGAFGIATDINDNYTTATYVNAVRLANNANKDIQVITRNKSSWLADFTGNNPVQKIHSMSDYFAGESGVPADGETVDITAYHFDNATYFYINGKFVDVIADYNKDITATRIGLYCSYGRNMQVLSVKADEIAVRKKADTLKIEGASARYANAKGEAVARAGGIKVVASINADDKLYSESNEFAIVLADKKSLGGYPLTVKSEGAVILNADAVKLNGDKAEFTQSLVNFSVAQMDTEYVIRAYVKFGDDYYYSDCCEYTPSRIAELYYLEETTSENDKKLMDEFLAESDIFEGGNAVTITMSVFSDFHYKEDMYTVSIGDLNVILDRANANNVDLILQAGDFTNDVKGSPEAINALLNNKYSLPAYGVYGNHELESGNEMGFVTPTLTNREVVWGTKDGQIGDGSVGYYYFEVKGFRFVCTDTNYSYNPTTKIWEHNYTNSFGPPAGNLYMNALGPTQLEWLDDVLTDAANKGIPCIVVSHAAFNGNWSDASSDAGKVYEIFNKVNDIRKRTVIMAINGHNHTNRAETRDNVFYFDVNCVRNGYWYNNANFYSDRTDLTYEFVSYDDEGNPISEPVHRKISDISHPISQAHIYYEDPLSSIVKISSNGVITVEGQTTSWLGGLEPIKYYNGLETKISDHNVLIK